MAALQAKQFAGLKASPVARRAVFSRSAKLQVSARAAAKPKAGSKAAAYVCLDCGYIYDGATPFEDLKSYACPVCNAPKRRFKPMTGAARGNDPKTMMARKTKLREQIEAEGGNPDEGGDELLVVAAVGILATLGLAYFLTQ